MGAKINFLSKPNGKFATEADFEKLCQSDNIMLAIAVEGFRFHPEPGMDIDDYAIRARHNNQYI